MILSLLLACSPDQAPTSEELNDRAYVVSELSNELFVFNAETLEEVASIDSSVRPNAPNANHMAMVVANGSKVYISATEADSVVVVDAGTLEVKGTLPVGASNTHMALREGTTQVWVMNEDDNSVSIVDSATDRVVATLSDPSFYTPHFARFSDGYAYIPSIAGNQISVVDLSTLRVVDVLVPEGLEMGACAGDPCGFADAQIAADGVLYASHIETGRVLVYDTIRHERLADITGLSRPWSAFVNPFDAEAGAMVPSWGDAALWRVGRAGAEARWDVGDSEVYGVNFSATAPDLAYVLNRSQQQVAIVDRATGARIDSLDVGGTTETATTTASGRLLLPVSSAGAVVVIDTATGDVLARYEGVGQYPWSVATSSGQNYCH